MKHISDRLPVLSSIILLSALGNLPVGYAVEPAHQDAFDTKANTTAPITRPSPIESLTPALRKLLSKEMLAIQQGMISITPAYAAGHWDEIERIANNIKNSYILKQSLTRQQQHELHTSLPEDFIRQDQHFHYLSGMLAHAASMKKAELVGFYFSKMSESCVSCHSQYANHRFPAFIIGKPVSEHDH